MTNIELPEDLIEILDKVCVKRSTTRDELVKHVLWSFCEKKYPSVVGIRPLSSDRFENLTDLEQITVWLFSKQEKLSIEEAFERMKKERRR